MEQQYHGGFRGKELEQSAGREHRIRLLGGRRRRETHTTHNFTVVSIPKQLKIHQWRDAISTIIYFRWDNHLDSLFYFKCFIRILWILQVSKHQIWHSKICTIYCCKKWPVNQNWNPGQPVIFKISIWPKMKPWFS